MKYKSTLLLAMVSILSIGMEKITLYDHAYNGNYSSLKERITDNDMTACDEHGSTLFMHAVVGVFAHKKYDNFKELIRLFKNHTFDFNAPAQGDSLVSNICFIANISLQCKNLKPLEIALQEGANPFFGSNSVYENMLTLAMNDQPEAFKVVGLMARSAPNIHDAAKSVCLAPLIKHVSPQAVNVLDAKQRSPLFYVIQYGSLAPKNDLILAIKLLKETGVDLNADIPHIPKKNYTYMHFATTVAALSKNTNVIKAMLDNGGSPYAGCGLSIVTPYTMAQKMQKQIPYYKNILEIFIAHLQK